MKNSDPVRLSPSEWRVMCAIWLLPAGGSSAEIRGVLQSRLGIKLSAKTLAVYLVRIEAKGYASKVPLEPRGHAGHPGYHYLPAVSHDQALKVEINDFLNSYCLIPDSLEVLRRELERRAHETSRPASPLLRP